jgi:hypothetical protein
MHNIPLTALAAAIVLSSGVLADRARSQVLTDRSLMEANVAHVQGVASVCGANGCVRVQTQKIRHHKPGSVNANHI